MDRFAAMETFLRVVDTGSFSSAARQLGVGQPAVSKTVAQLEERLGVMLLTRSTRGLSTTEAGHAFYERARSSVHHAEEAELAARGAGSGLSGPLRICAAVTFARLHVVPLLPEFLSLYPGIKMDVVLDDRSIDLTHEGIDVALRMGNLPDSALTGRRFGSTRRLVMATPAYLARAGVPDVPGDLAGHDAVAYGRDGNHDTWTFTKEDAAVAVAMRTKLKVSAAEGVRAAVLADMGLTIASEWMFSPELVSGAIRAVLEDWDLPRIDIWAIYPTGRLATAKARAFVAFVEERLSSLVAL